MLKDLYQLVKPIKETLDNFAGIDCPLPAKFKSAVKRINNDPIRFGQSASVVTNSSGQHIFFSNSWFYIAAALAPLYKPFEEYRKTINDIVSKEVLKNKDEEAIKEQINASSLSESDKQYLIKFATDYEWWTAGATKYGKSLDRNDCLVSAVLAIANVVNNSASYIANLWSFLADNPDIAQLLQGQLDSMVSHKQICITSTKVSSFVFEAMKYLQTVDRLQAFTPFVIESSPRYSESSSATIIKLGSDEFDENLVGCFIETTLDDIKKRNSATSTSRWFEHEFDFAGRKVFLSNQWNADGQYQLTFVEFKKILHEAYKGRFIADRTEDGRFILFEVVNPVSEFSSNYMYKDYIPQHPLQQIFFGAPGTSKSTRIKDLVGNEEQHRVTFHPDTDYASFVGCYKPSKEDDGKDITYKFVAQPFIKAYVSAWKKLYNESEAQKEVFLIVEEINRGNCAQIFGDLFQLLDRNSDGYSDYSIEPDSDLSRFLKEEFNTSEILVPEIKEGRIMKLPPNLFIWATMNTSDQSLFPIDSAFKRRWDWKYTPIKNAGKGHLIALKDRKYDWWEFLDAVNSRIEKVTESEDKQLGYWFAKPESGVEISAEKFVSKVIFYLWNDVFKDYGHDINSPFVIKLDDGKKKELRFKSFFTEDGEIDEKVLVLFFWGLKLNTKSGAAATATEEAQSGQDAGSVAPTEAVNPDNGGNEPQAKNAEEEDTFIDEDEELPEAESIDDFFK